MADSGRASFKKKKLFSVSDVLKMTKISKIVYKIKLKSSNINILYLYEVEILVMRAKRTCMFCIENDMYTILVHHVDCKDKWELMCH